MLFFLQVPFLHHKNSNAIKDMVTNFSAEVCFEDQLKKCSSFQFVENIVFLFVHLAQIGRDQKHSKGASLSLN